MTDLNRDDIAAVLVRLTETLATRATELQFYEEDGDPTETDEESDFNSTITDKFYDEVYAVGIAQMTNVSLNEFKGFHDLISVDLEN